MNASLYPHAPRYAAAWSATGLLVAIIAVLMLAGCSHNLQRSYVESMEFTRIAVEADVEHGLYKPDATSAATLEAWKQANEEAFKALIEAENK